MSEKSDIGIIGMGVMGQNLALNMVSQGVTPSVYNRTGSRTKEFIESRGGNVIPTYELDDFVDSLDKPRRVMLMIKAGKPVDMVVDELIPLLEEGDIIIDGGNSHFKDTERRIDKVEEEGLFYLGTGISGGEYGALHGPSIMPGGHLEAYEEVGDILESVAARTEEGPCCTYLGPRSAGHYVKMVHNGIEYGVMETIAEGYWLMDRALEMEPSEIGSVFEEWNETLNSYLVEITADILKREDPETGGPLIEMILDRAKQKGTGKWTVQSSLDLGTAVPTIAAGVNARLMSARKSDREKLAPLFTSPRENPHEGLLEFLIDGLYLSIISAYAQGMDLLKTASEEYDYGLELSEVARIWKDGCIIRSSLLDEIETVFRREPEATNLIGEDPFRSEFEEKIHNLRKAVTSAQRMGVPIPALSCSLEYFDLIRSGELPANLIQAQRDYFGAHTYERRDKEGTFHTDWQEAKNK